MGWLRSWGTIGPLGVPHRLTQNDTYRGYKIPKGSLVLSNIWYFYRLLYRIYSEVVLSGRWHTLRRTTPAQTTLIPFATLMSIKSAQRISCLILDVGKIIRDFIKLLLFSVGGQHTVFGYCINTPGVRRISHSRTGTRFWLYRRNRQVGFFTSQIMVCFMVFSQPVPFVCDISPRSELASKLVSRKYPPHNVI